MKKKLLITVAMTIISAVLTSCGSKKNTEDYVTAENFIVYGTTAYDEVEMVNADTMTKSTPQKKFTYALNGTTVELFIDDVKVNTLDYYYTPDSRNITVADFNRDGWEDIFIPYESPVDYGVYYCYIPEKNIFSENAQLNAVGRIMTVSEDGILTEDRSDDLTKRIIEYQWNGEHLNAIYKKETYKSSEDGKLHTDVYKYDKNGTEYLDDTTIEGE